MRQMLQEFDRRWLIIYHRRPSNLINLLHLMLHTNIRASIITRQMIIIVGASLSESAQSAKWRENGVPRNCILTTQCSYMDVLSVQLLRCSAVSLSTLHRAARRALSRCRRRRSPSLCSSVSSARRALSRSLLRRSRASLSSSESK